MTARDGSQQQQHHLHPVTMNIGCNLALSSQCAIQDLDPIVNLAGSRGLITAEWKVGICEFLLLVSLLFFVQAIRLLMYLVRRHGCSAVPACVARQKHVVRMVLCSHASVICQHGWTEPQGYLIKIRSAGEPFASAFPAELVLAFAARSGHCWTAGKRATAVHTQ